MNFTEDYNRMMAALIRQREEIKNSPELAREMYYKLRLWEVFPVKAERRKKKVICRLHGHPL